MLTYEITATVRPDLCDAYERYMIDTHVPDVLATGAFVAASISRAGVGRYRMRYDVRRKEDLERYITEHAPRLREHFHATLPDGVELVREEWDVLASWPDAGAKP